MGRFDEAIRHAKSQANLIKAQLKQMEDSIRRQKGHGFTIIDETIRHERHVLNDALFVQLARIEQWKCDGDIPIQGSIKH